MSEFYAKADDEYRCRKALLSKEVITISGQTADGKTGTFTGRVVSVEAGHRILAGYPLRLKILDLATAQQSEGANTSRTDKSWTFAIGGARLRQGRAGPTGGHQCVGIVGRHGMLFRTVARTE
jgi:hypothetical protein